MTASLAASSPVLRRPLLSFAVRSDFLLKPRISARSVRSSDMHRNLCPFHPHIPYAHTAHTDSTHTAARRSP